MTETWKLIPIKPSRMNAHTSFVVKGQGGAGGNVALVFGEEDARLIEQAPRMRELLAEVANWEAHMGGFEGTIWTEIHALLDGLRDANDAIAAARKEG